MTTNKWDCPELEIGHLRRTGLVELAKLSLHKEHPLHYDALWLTSHQLIKLRRPSLSLNQHPFSCDQRYLTEEFISELSRVGSEMAVRIRQCPLLHWTIWKSVQIQLLSSLFPTPFQSRRSQGDNSNEQLFSVRKCCKVQYTQAWGLSKSRNTNLWHKNKWSCNAELAFIEIGHFVRGTHYGKQHKTIGIERE